MGEIMGEVKDVSTPCPAAKYYLEDRPRGKVPWPWLSAAGLVGTAVPSSSLQVQRESHELILLFLVGVSTLHSRHRWDLGAGRAPVPPLLGRVLVLACSAPYEGASWCLGWIQLGAQLRAGGSQPASDTSSMSPVRCHCLQSTGVWLMYISWWAVSTLPFMPVNHVKCWWMDVWWMEWGPRRGSGGLGHLATACTPRAGCRQDKELLLAGTGTQAAPAVPGAGGKRSCYFRAQEILSPDERDGESPTGFVSCLSSPACPWSPSNGQIRAQAAAVSQCSLSCCHLSLSEGSWAPSGYGAGPARAADSCHCLCWCVADCICALLSRQEGGSGGKSNLM